MDEQHLGDLQNIEEDTHILTASGDESIKVWNIQERKCVRALMGHTGSIKSISSHPTYQELIVSGSRDGSFALWDIRCNTNQNTCLSPSSIIREAHTSPARRSGMRGKAESISITSVLYLKVEVSIATAGAVASVIKFWDTRNLKAPVTLSCSNSMSSDNDKCLHGISCLSQDSNGVFVTASCMNHRIYIYNVLQLDNGPIKTFSGGRTDSFFVKSTISPDAANILSGSSDGNAYIWQVNKPFSDPISLSSHNGKVTTVDWSPSETGEIATCSDDFTVRLWNSHSSYSYKRPPLSTRKRVMAIPRMERRQLFMNGSSWAGAHSSNLQQPQQAVIAKVTHNMQIQLSYADWRLRPLPREMIKYAREDTHYLLYIYDLMRTILLNASPEADSADPPLVEVYKRSYEICTQLYEKELLTDDSYLYIYGLHSVELNAQQLAIVPRLCE